MSDEQDRAAVCLAVCDGIPTEKLRGRTLGEYVADEAYIQNLRPCEGGGAELQLSGLACQLLAASFAGQFAGNGAVNYLEAERRR